MNISESNPWDQYWKRGGFVNAGQKPDPMKAGFRNPGVPAGAPTVQDALVSMDGMMGELKGRRAAPQRPAAMNIRAELERMGTPPRRPELPDRPGPDRSAGSILGQALSGASDVFAAAGGQRGNALDKFQGIQRQQADVQYQDQLRKAAADFENQNAGWNFQLQKLGMGQASSDREQGRYESDRAAHFAETDREASDLQRGIENRRAERLEEKGDNRYAAEVGRMDRRETIDKEQREWLKGQAGIQQGYNERALKMREAAEGREAQMFPYQEEALKRATGRFDEGNYRGLVGQQIGMSPDKQKMASDLAAGVDPKDPDAKMKLEILNDALRRASPDRRDTYGSGGWAKAVTSVPFLNLPYLGMGGLDEMFSGRNLLGPEAERADQRQEQIELLKRLREKQGIPMEGFRPTP